MWKSTGPGKVLQARDSSSVFYENIFPFQFHAHDTELEGSFPLDQMPTIILSQSRWYKQLYFTYSSASFEHMTIILSQRAGSINSCISAIWQPVLNMQPSHSHRAGSTNSYILVIWQYKQLYFGYLAASFEHATITLSQSRQYKQLYFGYLSASFEHMTITLSQSRQYKQLYFGYLAASFEHMTITLSQSRQYKQLYFGYLAASFEHATATLCSHCTPDNVLLDYTQGSDYFNDCPTKADTNSNTQDNGTSWSHINCFWSNKSRHSLILCDSNSNTQDNVSCYLIKSYQLLLVQQKQILTNSNTQ